MTEFQAGEPVVTLSQMSLGGYATVTRLVGGEGKPAGSEARNYVKPTVFAGVTNDVTITQEAIFGSTLSAQPPEDHYRAGIAALLRRCWSSSVPRPRLSP